MLVPAELPDNFVVARFGEVEIRHAEPGKEGRPYLVHRIEVPVDLIPPEREPFIPEKVEFAGANPERALYYVVRFRWDPLPNGGGEDGGVAGIEKRSSASFQERRPSPGGKRVPAVCGLPEINSLPQEHADAASNLARTHGGDPACDRDRSRHYRTGFTGAVLAGRRASSFRSHYKRNLTPGMRSRPLLIWEVYVWFGRIHQSSAANE